MGDKTDTFEDTIRRRIRMGEFPPDTRLPSERQLAADYGVGRTTVRLVLAQLAAEGLVRAEHGRGYFATPTAPGPAPVAPLTLTRLCNTVLQGQGIGFETLAEHHTALTRAVTDAIDLLSAGQTAQAKAVLRSAVDRHTLV